MIDFKTCEISEKVLQKYIRQLSSYSYAMTHPFSDSDFSLKLRNEVGLFVFEPDKFSIDLIIPIPEAFIITSKVLNVVKYF